MMSFQYTETKYMLTVQETARVLGVQCQQLKRNWHLPRKKIK